MADDGCAPPLAWGPTARTRLLSDEVLLGVGSNVPVNDVPLVVEPDVEERLTVVVTPSPWLSELDDSLRVTGWPCAFTGRPGPLLAIPKLANAELMLVLYALKREKSVTASDDPATIDAVGADGGPTPAAFVAVTVKVKDVPRTLATLMKQPIVLVWYASGIAPQVRPAGDEVTV